MFFMKKKKPKKKFDLLRVSCVIGKTILKKGVNKIAKKVVRLTN